MQTKKIIKSNGKADKKLGGEIIEKPTRSPRTPQALRGMRDILPDEQPIWTWLRSVCRRAADDYGFQRLDLPILEATSLFERSVGKATDIVEKEMYTFADRGEDSLSLRPEATASMVRAYIEHGFLNLPQPVKLTTDGSMYRYQRPQYGRQREFHQWDFEVIGDGHPVLDAELMVMATNIYAELGLNVTLQLNSIGDANCRPGYEKALAAYYRAHKDQLCDTCRERLQRSVLRLLDCKEEGCRALKAEAPQFVDHLCEPCKEHLMKIFEYLDEMDIPYVLNSQLVRGLDYYTRTVFEIWSAEDETGRTSLGGGGRYDKLVEMLGGRPTPASGFAVGMETTIIKMKEANVPIPSAPVPQVYIAQLGEPAKRKALKLFDELRKSGITVSANFSKDGLKHQMEQAGTLGVRYTLIIGQKEIVDGTIIIRDMEAGIQEIFDFKKVISEIQKKIAGDSGHKTNGSNG
jgi:histidyl-tRNA synthetase